jgi:ElaB/YqjD/DUF883 family membrane-anchored ribosome-binding protein
MTKSEHIDNTKQVQEENELLADQLKKTKQKLKLRDQAWMDKLQTARSEYEVLLEDYSTLERLMDAYTEQFKTVCHWTDEKVGNHPHPFSESFINVAKNAEKMAANVGSLEEQLCALKSNLSSQTLKVESLTESATAISNDKAQACENLKSHQQEAKSLGERVRALEKELELKDAKLKKIVGAYQQMIQ